MNKRTANIQQEIRSHLIKTKQEFDNHLSGEEEKFLFKLALRTPERQEKFQKILTWIQDALGDEAQERNKDPLAGYKTLYNNWNESKENKTEYDGSLDFGGRLLTLKNLLEKKEPPRGLTESEKNIISLLPKIILSINNFLVFSDSGYITTAERFIAEFNKTDLTIKANPNLNEGATSERKSNTRRLASSFGQVIEACKKIDRERKE
jgi:hypothetical protein